ncbi:MAG: ribokinase [Gammaproteobacteria bacterium]|nr:ribokinase [Gammaproteobacteria bacterium]
MTRRGSLPRASSATAHRAWVEPLPARAKPELIIVGQVTIDDVVPATPGAWKRQIGGSSLYALAGARLWLDASRIALLARVGRDYPFDVERLLRGVGLHHIALPSFPGEHLVEWLIYEADGSRRSLPRNPGLLDVGAEGSSSVRPYLQRLLDIAPTAEQIPATWLPAPALHLCPQAGDRHHDSLRALHDKIPWISVDPSPHYSRSLDAVNLARFLEGATAFLPSAQELRPLLNHYEPAALALELHRHGIAEVLLKRGADPIVLAHQNAVHSVPITSIPIVDPTGAGDSFCGAYAACRLLGHEPLEAARRAAASAARIVGCSGVESALELTVEAPGPL